MLIDRDDLYMKQDALLVDVEDISNRIQEYAVRLKDTNNLNESKTISPVKKTQKENTNNKSSNNNGFGSRFSKLSQLNNILTSKIYQFSRKTN